MSENEQGGESDDVRKEGGKPVSDERDRGAPESEGAPAAIDLDTARDRAS